MNKTIYYLIKDLDRVTKIIEVADRMSNKERRKRIKQVRKQTTLAAVVRRTYRRNRGLAVTPSPPALRPLGIIIQSAEKRLEENPNYSPSTASTSSIASLNSPYTPSAFYPEGKYSPISQASSDETNSTPSTTTPPILDTTVLHTPKSPQPQSPLYSALSPSYHPTTPSPPSLPSDVKPPPGLNLLKQEIEGLAEFLPEQGPMVPEQSTNDSVQIPNNTQEPSKAARELFPIAKTPPMAGLKILTPSKICSLLLEQAGCLDWNIPFISDTSGSNSTESSIELTVSSPDQREKELLCSQVIQLPEPFIWTAKKLPDNKLQVQCYKWT